MLPTKVRLEACTLCQLNCRDCYMRLKNNCGLGAGYLKYEDFAAFLELNPYVKKIELSNSGEIFLNPDLDKIVERAFAEGVKLFAHTGVNLNTASPKILEDLVKYQFEGLTVSIDGWNQDVYSWYRRNGDFNKVIDNIKLINEFKEKHNSLLPHLIWKYIIFQHNDDDNGAKVAERMAKELGMDFIFAPAWNGYEPKNIKIIDQQLMVDTWGIPCSQIWLEPRINWDGKFFGCCINGDFPFDDANLFEIPLAEYLESPVIKNAKLCFTGYNYTCDMNQVCQTCFYYKMMQQSGNFITNSELEKGGRIVHTCRLSS